MCIKPGPMNYYSFLGLVPSVATRCISRFSPQCFTHVSGAYTVRLPWRYHQNDLTRLCEIVDDYEMTKSFMYMFAKIHNYFKSLWDDDEGFDPQEIHFIFEFNGREHEIEYWHNIWHLHGKYRDSLKYYYRLLENRVVTGKLILFDHSKSPVYYAAHEATLEITSKHVPL